MSNSSVNIKLDSINLVQGEGGRKNWELTAKKSKYFKDREVIKVYLPKVKFYLKNSQKELIIEAPLGTASPQQSEIELQDGIDANYAGNELVAESMHYRAKKDEIHFLGGVSFSQDSFLVKSRRACLDLANKRLSFEQEVQVYLPHSP